MSRMTEGSNWRHIPWSKFNLNKISMLCKSYFLCGQWDKCAAWIPLKLPCKNPLTHIIMLASYTTLSVELIRVPLLEYFNTIFTCSTNEYNPRHAANNDNKLPNAQLPLGSSHHVTSRHDTYALSNVSSSLWRACRTNRASRVECVEPCCSTSSTQPKCMGLTCQTCRVMSRSDVTNQVEFGLYCIAANTTKLDN